MNFRRFLEIPRAPEDEGGAAPEPEVAENALAGDTPAPEPEPQLELEPEPAAREHGNKGKTPWYMDRINEETNKRASIEGELAKERRERQEAQALLERLQKPGEAAPAATPRADAPDFESAVEAAAEKKLLFKNSTEVRLTGEREFIDFGESLKILTAVGATTDEFVSDVLDTDMASAHKMFDFLAKNPERTASLVNMNSRRRVAELTRISMSEIAKPAAAAAPAPAPKPAPVSKVPAPKPVVDASGGIAEVDEEKMSDLEWAAWRKREMAKRSA